MASLPVSSRGFGFRLLGIPIEVSWWFFFIAAMLGISGTQSLGRLGVWVAVMFVGILVHELGHAVAVRLFGAHPAIMIQGFFNVTVWQAGPTTAPWKRLIVSLAGPAAGIALGALLLGLGISRHLSQTTLAAAVLGATGEPDHAIDQLVLDGLFVNLGWSILNLLPIMPLDGGKVVASLLDMVAPGRGTKWALWFSVVAGVALCFAAYYFHVYILAIFMAWSAVLAFGSLQAASRGGAGAGAAGQARGAEPALAAVLQEASRALEARDLPRAIDRAELVREKSRSPALLGQAVQILASAAVLAEDFVRADALLGTMPPGEPVDVALRGLVALRRGRHEEAFTALAEALDREPGDTVALAVTEAAVRTGRGGRIAELLTAPRIRRALSPTALRHVADELAVAGERDGAVALRRLADAGSLS